MQNLASVEGDGLTNLKGKTIIFNAYVVGVIFFLEKKHMLFSLV